MSVWRDLYAGDVRPDHVGQELTVAGWVARRRDHGGLIFIDLRDHTGIVQLVVNPERAPEAAQTAHDIRSEFVVRAQGEVVRRAPDAVNPNIPTGEVELQVNELEIVSRSEPLPFQIDDEGVEEPIRLRYRYLDLRRDRMQRNLRLSATVIGAIRRSMEEQGFIDVWTPSMTLGTPEGARDFLIPMRLQPGRFYALAQSPQLFKQLFMVGGIDRYYQIATAWRDEDLRADRQFEFRQLDLELAFPRRARRCSTSSSRSSSRRSRRSAGRRRHGRSRACRMPTRCCATAPTSPTSASVWKSRTRPRSRATRSSGCSRTPRRCATSSRRSRSRAASCRKLEDFAKEWGAKGLAYPSTTKAGRCARRSRSSSRRESSRHFARRPARPFSSLRTARRWWSGCSAPCVSTSARELGLVDESRDEFHWVLDFPLFLKDEDTGQWTFVHHPFTSPAPGHDDLIETDPGAALSQHYDLVWNGWELGSGSIRIHRQEIQERVFRAMGMSDEEARAKFGWFLEALRLGAPPHGGFALGIERFVALLAGESNIREVIAFPKTASGSDPLTGAPAPTTKERLDELGISVKTPKA